QLGRLGASLDWTREVFTLDPGVSRAVRQVFVSLYEKGLIYRGRYIVNWCPFCQTAISDEEVVFSDRCGKLYYIAYPYAEGEGEVVVGTTRPETMLGDVAVAMSPSDERAGELEGRLLQLPLTGRKIPIILDEAVDPEFGTGCLKVTPAHDATDFEIGLRHGLEPMIVINREGKMNEVAGEFAGLDRFDARESVLKALEEKGLLRRVEDYNHAIGRHDRCNTVIELAASLQWFLRMKQLAGPGIDVAENGEIVFFPERWKNIYLSWMRNIRDWCISRQLWWGHRIPVWYCSECREMVAAVDEPAACPRCGSRKLVQDEDVLDTWFSSWLWTFSPMGWPEKTGDLRTFHPTSILVTAGDIIFFWVARMIMAALEFMGEIPFPNVYITGIVRDVKGRKMSKSLGNSPDPIDIIDHYGADAFRFTLMMLSPPGQDLLFDEKKVELGKHFANKIWNAARFVLGQVDGEVTFSTERSSGDSMLLFFESLYGEAPDQEMEFRWEDRWIASRLACRTEEFEHYIDTYRFDEAARTIYDFFWHEFCDWYLELSKPAFRKGGVGGRGSAVTARAVLGASMALLHPFMPFITEEIWSMISQDAGLLADLRFPGIPGDLRDVSLEHDVELFKEIVSTIRNLRQTFNVPHSKGVNAVINCEKSRSLPGRLSVYSDQIRLLARVDELEIAEEAGKPEGCAAAGLALIEIYLPLKGIIDLDVERQRLLKDLEKFSSECDKIKTRLEDRRFLDRAPGEVVEREKSRFEEISDRRLRIGRILEDLG
ncbi:MAG: valine--tRNA ligase, partial [Candidatus Krumholzibacteria bacterium]|nr:valine--tRNA ligase [Candidatus Krumholzibacteria bacterium]